MWGSKSGDSPIGREFKEKYGVGETPSVTSR